MPNTLAHLGINGLVTRTLIKKADLILIYIGAVIPDFPWIIQRFVSALIPQVNIYDLRLYCVILASLFFSIILSAALSYLFIDTKRTFIIFSAGSLIHLLLDSIEIKWANGVHLFAPFSWELFNAGFFWPESIPIYMISAFGLFYLIFNWKETISTSINVSFKNFKKVLAIFIFIIIYFSLPVLFLDNAEAANNHYVKTLRDREHRIGNYFEIDRGNYIDDSKGDRIITPFHEELKVVNLNIQRSEKISIRAKFISRDKIQILDYHIHGNRELFSLLGLLLILIFLIISIANNFRYKTKSAAKNAAVD